jgi:hypothetical protein
VKKSLEDQLPPFEVIRTLVPSWDNEARKPSCGFGLVGSDPDKYSRWLRGLVEQAKRKPFMGKVPYVFVNA